MEFKVEQQVIRLKEDLKTETAEHSIESELILPDNYGDIGRILKCKGEPQILSANASGQTVTVEGIVTLHLLYVNTEGELTFYCQSLPFYHEAPVPEEGAIATVTPKMDFCNCRGVNNRKVEIRGAVSMKLCFQKINDLTLVTNAVGGGVQLQKTKGELSTLLATAEKTLTLNDEIQMDSGSIHHLLRWKGTVRDTEYKVVSGKVLVKGNLEIMALYQDMQGRYCPLQSKLPFSQVLDMEGLEPECLCTLRFQVISLELRPRTGLDGECKTLMVNATVQVTAQGVKTLTLPLVTDGFSTQCGLGIRKWNGNLHKLLETVEETHLCKKQIDLGREIGSVVDIWCEVTSDRVQCEKNKVTVSGILTVCLLVLDSDNLPVYTEKAVDYHWEYTPKEEVAGTACTPDLTVTDVSYSLSSDTTVDLRAHLVINAPVYGVVDLHPVVELNVDTSVTAPTCPAPLVVYFAKEGEPIFAIARRYATTCRAILEANNLTEEVAPGGALLVPACKD